MDIYVNMDILLNSVPGNEYVKTSMLWVLGIIVF